MSDLSRETVDRPLVLGSNADGDPMIRDLDLAAQLGYKSPLDIRKIIRRLQKAKTFNDSVFFATVAKTSPKGGRPGREYWLTLDQAVTVTLKSDTPNANSLTKKVVRVFLDARKGKLPESVSQAPQLPAPPTDAEKRAKLLKAVSSRPGVGLAIARYGHLFDHQVLREVAKHGPIADRLPSAIGETVELLEQVQKEVDAVDVRMARREAELAKKRKPATRKRRPVQRELPSGHPCLALVPKMGAPAVRAACA